MKGTLKRLKSKAGMTYVELLVAFTLLIFVIMAFSPMLLQSYDWIYQAGERVSDTYEAKSELEKELSIREDDELVNNGIAVNMRKFTNQFAIQMRRVTTEVNGLETIYGVGRAQLRIISSEVISDNQAYYPIVIRLVNFTGASVSIGDTHSSNKNDIKIKIKSLIKDDKNLSYTLDTSNLSSKIIKVIISKADITYSPFEMTAYYYDEYGRKRTTTSNVFITAPDLMFVGKSTAEAQYLTSAGVTTDESNRESMIIAGRKMEDMAIPADTKINKVRWLTSTDGSDIGIRSGTYAMCGIQADGSAFIRRLWNLDSEGGATYSNVYKPDGVVYVNNIAYYKYIWGSDYTQPVTRGWVKWNNKVIGLFNNDETDSIWSTTYSLNDSYNNVVAKNMQNTLYAGTNYLMQLCSTYSNDYMIAAAKNDSSVNLSSGEIIKSTKSNLMVTYGNQMPNWQGNDGYSGINLTGTRLRTNGWVSYINFDATGLTKNISSTNTSLGGKNIAVTNGDYSDPTKKAAIDNNHNTSLSKAVFESAVPILFFASDDSATQSKIDRYFIADDNNWGSELRDMTYGIRTKGLFSTYENTITYPGWYTWNSSTLSFGDSGHEPRERHEGAKMVGGILYYAESTSNYHNNYKTNDPYHSNTRTWSENVNHSCWECDVPASFTTQVTTNGGKYVIKSGDTLATRQQKIMDLILDNMGLGSSDRLALPSNITAFTGNTGYNNDSSDKKDEKCSFIRLKAFTNLNGTFNEDFAASGNLTVDSSLTQKAEGKDLDGYGFDNNDNRSDVELTDVFYIKDASDSTLDVVYAGITPASSFLYGPYVNTTKATDSSNGYTIYIITSYGDDGFAIYSKENIGHDAYNVTDFNSSYWTGRRYLKTASYTLGYSSNYSLLYGNLAETELDKYSNSPLALSSPLSDYDNKLDHYTKDFYNMTTFTESEGYTFAVGYRVIGYAGVNTNVIGSTDKASFQANYESYYKNLLGVTNMYYATCPADFFTSDNFNPNVADSTSRYYTTLETNMTTKINDGYSQKSITAFYFDARDNNNCAFVTSYPVSGAAYTALTGIKVASGKEGDASIPCNAVANEGVIEYMNPGDTSFTQLKYSFASNAPHNFKFTNVSFVKTGGKIEKDSEGNVIVDDPDKLELVISASNGCVYHGTLAFTITQSTVQATDPETGEPIYEKNPITGKEDKDKPVYEEIAVINSAQVVQLYEYDCPSISMVRTVSTASYDNDDGETVTVLLASGKQKGGSTVICVSTDLGATWREVTASSVAYDIYDIKASGDYVYAVGTTADGKNGVVLYKNIAGCSSSSSWGKVTQYCKSFATTGLSDTIIGSGGTNLPPIYSCASKSA